MSDRKPIAKPDLGKVHCSICGTTDYECLGCHLLRFHKVHAPAKHTNISNHCYFADKTPEHLGAICSRRVWIERAHHAEKLLKSHTNIWLAWFSQDPVDSTVKENLTVGDSEREDFLADASTWVPPVHEPLDNPSKFEHGPLPSAGFSEPKSDIPTYVCDECGERVSGCMGCHLRDVHGIHSTFSHNLSNECFGKMSEYTKAPTHKDDDTPAGFKRLDPDQAECFVAENKRVTELFYAMDQAFRESGCFGVFLDRIETIVMAHAREADPDPPQCAKLEGLECRVDHLEIALKKILRRLAMGDEV